jgi:hypothetical protein
MRRCFCCILGARTARSKAQGQYRLRRCGASDRGGGMQLQRRHSKRS